MLYDNNMLGGNVTIKKGGGTTTGPVYLLHDPVDPLEALTKNYTDVTVGNLDADNIYSGVLPSNVMPAFTGDLTSTAGSAYLYLTNTSVVAGTYSKVTVDAKGRITLGQPLGINDIPNLSWSDIQSKPTTIDGYGITDALTSTGGTLTGMLGTSSSPVGDSDLVNKGYFESLTSKGNFPVGTIVELYQDVLQSGYLRCNGSDVSKTTYAALFNKIGTRYNPTSMIGNGRPWIFQFALGNSAQQNVKNWSKVSDFPVNIDSSTVFVTKNRVYVIGGYNGTALTSAVYTAEIYSDGSLGTWTSGPAYPTIISDATAIVVKNRVYVLGGANTTATSINYYSLIDSDGKLTGWVSAGESFGHRIAYANTFVNKNRLYVVGGWNGVTQTASAAVYYAIINTDGSLSSWTQDTALPVALANVSLASVNDTLYVIGGMTGGYTGFVNTVYTATLNNDGSIGAWKNGVSLPFTYAELNQCYTSKNRIYLVGGIVNGVASSKVYSAQINNDFSVSSFKDSGFSLPTTMTRGSMFVTHTRLYCINTRSNTGASAPTYQSGVYYGDIFGGLNDYSRYYNEISVSAGAVLDGYGQPWKQQRALAGATTSDISGWVTGNNLPAIARGGVAFVTKSKAYVFGGWNGTAHVSTGYVANINTDGSLAGWTTTVSLPGILAFSYPLVMRSRVYLIGGYSSAGTLAVGSTTAERNIYSAVIDTDGTLGTWSIIGQIPVALYGMVAFVNRNKLFVVGGCSPVTGAASNAVYSTTINTDGTFGSWSLSNSLPAERAFSSLAVIDNYVYLFGGTTTTNVANVTNTVYRCTMNNDGSISAWTLYGTLPVNYGFGDSYISQGFVFLLGGIKGTAASGGVYKAAIDSNGAVGSFSLSNNALPVSTIHNANLITTTNKVHLISGLFNNADSAGSYIGTIVGSMNDYSSFYSDGSSYASSIYTGANSWLNQYSFNNSGQSDITGWTNDTNTLPVALAHSAAIVTKNRVYLLGGYVGSNAVNTIYTATIDNAGVIGAWSIDTHTMPAAVRSGVAIVCQNYVYYIGGFTTTLIVPASNKVYRSEIDTSGLLTGWTEYNTLPAPVNHPSVGVVGSKVYIVGGTTATDSTSGSNAAVYYADISSTGNIGAWTQGLNHPETSGGKITFTLGSTLYSGGGMYGADQFRIAMYKAVMDSNGVITAWTAVTNLPTVTYGVVTQGIGFSSVYVTKNYVFLIGNRTGQRTGSGVFGGGYTYNYNNGTNTIFRIAIVGGQISGSWSTVTNFPYYYDYGSVVVTSRRIYAIGGNRQLTATGTAAYGNMIQYAAVTGGSNDYSQSVLVNNTSSIVGDGYGQPWNIQQTLGNSSVTELTNWRKQGDLPVPTFNGMTFVTKNWVYMVGGSIAAGGTPVNTVYRAPINADGTLGAWELTTALPIPLAAAKVIAVKNRIYLLGGYTLSGGTIVTAPTIYYASINSDGTLGAWVAGISNPNGGTEYANAFVNQNRLYYVGGSVRSASNGTATTAVYYSTILTDGSLSAWVAGPSLVTGVHYSALTVVGNKVYHVGGHTSYSTWTIIVQSATLNNDGSIGVWSVIANLPTQYASWNQIYTNSKAVFLVSGILNGTISNAVYKATIGADGTLGAFAPSVNVFPATLYYSQVVATKDHVYTIGGTSQTTGASVPSSAIYVADNTGGLNDYSDYYQNDSIVSATDDSTFRLPDFSVNDTNTHFFIKY